MLPTLVRYHKRAPQRNGEPSARFKNKAQNSLSVHRSHWRCEEKTNCHNTHRLIKGVIRSGAREAKPVRAPERPKAGERGAAFGRTCGFLPVEANRGKVERVLCVFKLNLIRGKTNQGKDWERDTQRGGRKRQNRTKTEEKVCSNELLPLIVLTLRAPVHV